LQNAIGVILGSNIGTTLNSLWVAYMWFGTFKIAAYALPLIWVGGVIHIITKREKRLDIAHIAIGVGLLFVGLDYMKGSVELIALGIDLTSFTNLRAFGVIGMHEWSAYDLPLLSSSEPMLVRRWQLWLLHWVGQDHINKSLWLIFFKILSRQVLVSCCFNNFIGCVAIG